MKQDLLFITIICGLVSCKSGPQDISQVKTSDTPVTIDSLINKFDSISDFSYKVDQLWKVTPSGTSHSLSGDCEFTRIPDDTIIGAHYKLTSDNITMLYNGDLFLYSDEDKKSVMIYKLAEYPDPRNRVLSSILYYLSYNEIMNEIKKRYLNRPNSIIPLTDTVINKREALRFKLIDKDTVVGENHTEVYKLVAFDRESLIPLVATKISITTGDSLSGQTIEAKFSSFLYSTAASSKTYDINAIPFNLQTITYAEEK